MNNKLAQLLIELDNDNPGKSEEIAKKFVQLMRTKGLDYQLSRILKIIESKARESKKILYITLSEEIDVIEDIKKLIGVENVETIVKIDKTLKGGFIAQYNNKLYNGSISQQLDKILCQ